MKIIPYDDYNQRIPPPSSGTASEQSQPISATTRPVTDGGSSRLKRILIYDDFNATFPKNQDVIGTVRQTFGAWAFTNGYKIFEIEDDDILPDRP